MTTKRSFLKPQTIALIGNPTSPHYKKVFEEKTIEGFIVLSLSSLDHYQYLNLDDSIKERLENLNLWKITIADEIFIVNPGNEITPEMLKMINQVIDLGIGIKMSYLVNPETYAKQGGYN